MNGEKAHREKTRPVCVGDVIIGGGAEIAVQSMAKAPTTDVLAVLRQCEEVRRAGGDLMRVAVPDEASANALRQIVENSPLPIIADIHFDYRLALKSLDAGVHKLRINPGNIGSPERVREIAHAATARGVPIRIGVNSGSLPKDIAEKLGCTPEAMVAAAARKIEILRDVGFEDIVVSLKSSSPTDTLAANTLFASKFHHPLHIGITEAGFGYQGLIASSVGLALILSAGIGDTMRVSLTDRPSAEVVAAREILRFMGLRRYGARLISCPKCARCEADTFAIARGVWERIRHIEEDISVAVMGCVVNGPGEASHADIGIALGKGYAMLFRKGEKERKIPEQDIIKVLVEEVERMCESSS